MAHITGVHLVSHLEDEIALEGLDGITLEGKLITMEGSYI